MLVSPVFPATYPVAPPAKRRHAADDMPSLTACDADDDDGMAMANAWNDDDQATSSSSVSCIAAQIKALWSDETGAEDYSNSAALFRADRCPACLSKFNTPVFFPDIKRHVGHCAPGLPGKLVHTHAADAAGLRAHCPVAGCSCKYQYAQDCYGHVLGASGAAHVAYRAALLAPAQHKAAIAAGRVYVAHTADTAAKPRRVRKESAQGLARRLVRERKARERTERNTELKARLAAELCEKVAMAKELYAQAKSGRPAAVAVLLGSAVQFDPNGGGEDGFTPLMTAAEAGYDRVVARLLGCDRVKPNAKNAYGQTALAFAAQNGRHTTVDLLLGDSRVNPAATTASGTTAAVLARGAGHLEVAAAIDAEIEHRGAAALHTGLSNDDVTSHDADHDADHDDGGDWDAIDELGDHFALRLRGYGALAGHGLRWDTRCSPGKVRLRPYTGKDRRGGNGYSMTDPLVKPRAPTKVELSVVADTRAAVAEVAEARARALGLTVGDKLASCPDRPGKTVRVSVAGQAYSRTAFLAKHRESVAAEFPDAKIVPAPVSGKVLHQFAAMVDHHGVFPEVGFHGSRAANWGSIWDKGILNPAQHSFIPSCIPGVYTTKLGNGQYSRHYTDTPDVFVCGIVIPPQHKGGAPGPASNKPAKTPKTVGQHREHRKPISTHTAGPSANHRRPVLDYVGVRVVNDERLIAPLFIAKGAYANPHPNMPTTRSRTVISECVLPVEPGVSRNKKGAPVWVGRRRLAIEEGGGEGETEATLVWLPPTAEGGSYLKHAKRRFETKKRHRNRRDGRDAKHRIGGAGGDSGSGWDNTVVVIGRQGHRSSAVTLAAVFRVDNVDAVVDVGNVVAVTANTPAASVSDCASDSWEVVSEVDSWEFVDDRWE